jgi:hypothetical protein
MKGYRAIGVIVLLLLVGIGIAMYASTRPPDRKLDAAGRAWVDGFTAWSNDMSRAVERAEVEIGISRGERLSDRNIDPLRGCSTQLAAIGEPPILLTQALTDGRNACAEIAYAISIFEGYGSSALASTDKHLQGAWRLLQAARLNIQRQLEGDSS